MTILEHILFWILVLATIAVALWMLLGSPTVESGLIAISVFVVGSELLLWRALFSIDKRTAVGFTKFGGRLEQVVEEITKIKIESQSINSRLNKIEDAIAVKRK